VHGGLVRRGVDVERHAGNFPKGYRGASPPPASRLEAFSAGDQPVIAGSPWQSRHCPLSSAKAAPASSGRIATARIAVKKDRSVRLRGIAIASTPCSMSRIAESRGVAVLYVDCIHTASILPESRKKYRRRTRVVSGPGCATPATDGSLRRMVLQERITVRCRRFQGTYLPRGDIPGPDREKGKECPPLREGVSTPTTHKSKHVVLFPRNGLQGRAV